MTPKKNCDCLQKISLSCNLEQWHDRNFNYYFAAVASSSKQRCTGTAMKQGLREGSTKGTLYPGPGGWKYAR